MDRFKGTAGEWQLHYLPQHRYRVTADDGAVSICDIALWMTDYEEQAANASAIAAVPQLIAALVACKPHIDALRVTDDAPEYKALYTQVCASLSKALSQEEGK